jgi:uncharacterized membrane protein YfcA
MQELLLFLVGIIVGGMNAIAGGGMLIGFPALLAAGLPALSANVTGYVVIIPGQITSIFAYRSYLRKLNARYLVLLIPCLFGGAIGATLLRETSREQFAMYIPWLILFAVVLFATQPYIHFHLKKHIAKKSQKTKTLLYISLGLLPTAAYGAYFGPGFGFIMLAFLSFANLRDIHLMNALKNIAGLCIASMAIIVVYSTHLIDWRLGLAMAAGNGIGGFYGARFSQRFSSQAIRIVVIVTGICAALYLGLRNYS